MAAKADPEGEKDLGLLEKGDRGGGPSCPAMQIFIEKEQPRTGPGRNQNDTLE